MISVILGNFTVIGFFNVIMCLVLIALYRKPNRNIAGEADIDATHARTGLNATIDVLSAVEPNQWGPIWNHQNQHKSTHHPLPRGEHRCTWKLQGSSNNASSTENTHPTRYYPQFANSPKRWDLVTMRSNGRFNNWKPNASSPPNMA